MDTAGDSGTPAGTPDRAVRSQRPAPVITVRIQAADFDAARETAQLTAGRTDIGAVVTFTGLCRDEDGRLAALELEHYPAMADRQLRAIAREAALRFDLLGLTVIHRHGRIAVGGQIVLVAAAAGHRQAAFDGANCVMDVLKTTAPFWKKEELCDGRPGPWIAAREADDTVRDKWR